MAPVGGESEAAMPPTTGSAAAVEEQPREADGSRHENSMDAGNIANDMYTSLGVALHPNCTPCAFTHRPKGCVHGIKCQRCHHQDHAGQSPSSLKRANAQRRPRRKRDSKAVNAMASESGSTSDQTADADAASQENTATSAVKHSDRDKAADDGLSTLSTTADGPDGLSTLSTTADGPSEVGVETPQGGADHVDGAAEQEEADEASPEKVSEQSDDDRYFSLGVVDHPNCTPCAFVARPKGCLGGVMCSRCHHKDHTKQTTSALKRANVAVRKKLLRAMAAAGNSDTAAQKPAEGTQLESAASGVWRCSCGAAAERWFGGLLCKRCHHPDRADQAESSSQGSDAAGIPPVPQVREERDKVEGKTGQAFNADDEERRRLGVEAHPNCAPCAFVARPKGCLAGEKCKRCHHPDHAGQTKCSLKRAEYRRKRAVLKAQQELDEASGRQAAVPAAASAEQERAAPSSPTEKLLTGTQPVKVAGRSLRSQSVPGSRHLRAELDFLGSQGVHPLEFAAELRNRALQELRWVDQLEARWHDGPRGFDEQRGLRSAAGLATDPRYRSPWLARPQLLEDRPGFHRGLRTEPLWQPQPPVTRPPPGLADEVRVDRRWCMPPPAPGLTPYSGLPPRYWSYADFAPPPRIPLYSAPVSPAYSHRPGVGQPSALLSSEPIYADSLLSSCGWAPERERVASLYAQDYLASGSASSSEGPWTALPRSDLSSIRTPLATAGCPA